MGQSLDQYHACKRTENLDAETAVKAEIEHDSRSACLKARGSPEWPGMVGAHSTFSCLTLIVLGMDTIQTYAKEVCPGIPHPHDPS